MILLLSRLGYIVRQYSYGDLMLALFYSVFLHRTYNCRVLQYVTILLCTRQYRSFASRADLKF